MADPSVKSETLTFVMKTYTQLIAPARVTFYPSDGGPAIHRDIVLRRPSVTTKENADGAGSAHQRRDAR